MKQMFWTLLVLWAGLVGCGHQGHATPSDERFATAAETHNAATSPGTPYPLPAHRRHDQRGQLKASGTVVKVLGDDNEGSRHQRFILRLATGQTVLVAHNIDVAPRIPALKSGDTVEFYGEFEPNPQGGVVHWTHHDPAGRHAAGWLKHRNRTYQ